MATAQPAKDLQDTHSLEDLLRERLAALADYSDDFTLPISEGRCTIKDKRGRIVTFVPNKHQLRLNALIKEAWDAEEPIWIIILKARQVGFSTGVGEDFYCITAWQQGITGIIVADNLAHSTNIFNMIKRSHLHMNPICKMPTKASNAKRFEFNGMDSSLEIDTAEGKRVGQSATYQLIHCSEVAYFPNPDETMLSLMQTVPDVGRAVVVLESTANGVGNYFYDVVMDAKNGKNQYVLIFVPWFDHEEYSRKIPAHLTITPQSAGEFGDEVEEQTRHNLTLEQIYWRRLCIKNKCKGDLTKFRQEYPGTVEEAFIGSGYPVFDHYRLAEIEAADVNIPALCGLIEKADKGWNIRLRPDTTGVLKVWEKPEVGINPVSNTPYKLYHHRYVLGADTGGTYSEADFSVVYVYDRLYGRIVACLHDRPDPYEFAEQIIALAKWYDNARVAVEVNKWASETDDQGETVIDLLRVKYSNLYTHQIKDDVTKEWTAKIGWHTNEKTKGILVDKLREYTKEWSADNKRRIICNDADLIEEMKTYIISKTEKGKTAWEAQKGKKDDRVIAFGICLAVSAEMEKVRIKETPDPVTGPENVMGKIAI
jgi:hypothetical protein